MARKYKRDSRGRFAGGGSAVKTTVGKAGGYASVQHQQNSRAIVRGRAARQRRNALLKRGAGVVGGAAAVGLAGALAGHGRRSRGSQIPRPSYLKIRQLEMQLEKANHITTQIGIKRRLDAELAKIR